MPRTSSPDSILLHPTVTGEDVRRLVDALRENTRVREEELRELRAENQLRRYTVEELAELTKVPEARLRRIIAMFPHLELIGGRKGRGNKASLSRADAVWLVERMGKGGLDELMEAEVRKSRHAVTPEDQVKTA